MRPFSRLVAACTVALGTLVGSAAVAGVGFIQPPDMVNGTDFLSMHRTFGPVVVDDFTVDKPQILGVRWWGSYFLDAGQSPQQPRLVTFELSHHVDCPANTPVTPTCPGDPRGGAAPAPYPYSTPGQPYQFQILQAQETFFGTTAQGEDVYEYLVMFAVPWATNPGAIEWIDIAWAAGQFGTDPAADIWGWHESDLHHFDWAVQTDRIANPQLPLGGNPHLGPWNLLEGRDMAFQLLVAPEPTMLALVALGLLGGALVARRGRSRA